MKVGSLTVGETLSTARRQHGLTIEAVAADTCIRATIISAIESDRFEPCGGAVYARGHIRSIARVVGLDAEPLVAEFNRQGVGRGAQPATVISAVAAATTAGDPELYAQADRRRPHWTLAIAMALVVVCVIAIAGLAAGHGRSGAPHHTGTGAAGKTSPSTATTTPASPSSSAPQASASPHATMAVSALRGKSWVSITTTGGKELYEGLIDEGQVKTFSNKHGLTYTIGNAPAVDVVVNGNDIGSPPASGAVARGNVKPGAATVDGA